MTNNELPSFSADTYHDPADLHQTVLEPRVGYVIDTTRPLAEAEGYDVVALIDAGPSDYPEVQSHFLVVQLKQNPRLNYREFGGDLYSTDIDFILIDPTYKSGTDHGYKGIRRGETVDIGRGQDVAAKRFNLSKYVSTNHFTIGVNEAGELNIEDNGSTNGTSVVTAAETRKLIDVDETTRPRVEDATGPLPNEFMRVMAQGLMEKSGVEEPAPVEQPVRSGLFGAPVTPKASTELQFPVASVEAAKPEQPAEIAEAVEAFAHQPVVEAPIEQKADPGDSDVSRFFESPESLMKSLHDPELDGQVRGQIGALITAWQELQACNVTGEIWENFVQPNLGKLNTEEIEPQLGLINDVKNAIRGFAGDMHTFQQLVADNRGDMGYISSFLAQKNFSGQTEMISTLVAQIKSDEFDSRMARELGFGTEEADMQVQRLKRGVGYYNLSDEDASKFLNDLGKVGVPERLKDVAGAIAEFREQEKYKNWRVIKDDLVDIANRATLGTSESREAAASREMTRLMNDYTALSEVIQRRGVDHRDVPELIDKITGASNRLREALRKSERFYRQAAGQSKWLLERS